MKISVKATIERHTRIELTSVDLVEALQDWVNKQATQNAEITWDDLDWQCEGEYLREDPAVVITIVEIKLDQT